MKITLRPLEAGDLATVHPWFADSETRRWLGGPGWADEALSLAQQPGRHALLALDDGCPVGLVDIERYEDGRASFAIAIDPGHRRKGTGSAVVAAVFADPAMRGVRETFAGVEAQNLASERLLLRCGFVAVTGIDNEGFRYFARPAPTGRWRQPD